MMRYYKNLFSGTSLLTGLGLILLSNPVFANEALSDTLQPRAEVSVKGGSERSTLTTEFWAPLAQQSGKVLYTDIRLMGDDDDNREGNLGVGYRQISPATDSVLGGHLWIDRRRTEHNSTFHQLTFGAESLGQVIDLRANGYIPLNGTNTITTPNIGSTSPYLAGSGLYYDTNGSISETPQYGIDAEIGYRLPILQKQADTIRIYGGGYSFFRSSTETVTGFRVRTEAQVNRILSVGARFQHDGPRGSQGFLEATLRFPFSAKKLYQEKGLYGRLDESPERDIDIVTSAKVDTGLRKPILNTSGTQQRILYVDNSNTQTGDGTKENPFNNLASAQTALQANDILYIFHGDGTTTRMNQGITISQSGITLIGSGSDLTIQGLTFLQAGAAPTITNTNGDGITISGNRTTVKGVTVSGATGSGIFAFVANGSNFDRFTVSNVTLNNNGVNGLYFLTKDAGSHIGQITTDNLTINGNAQYGVLVNTKSSSIVDQVSINNVTTNNHAVDGIRVQADTGGTIDQTNIDTISGSSNNRTVAIVSSGTNSLMNNVTLNNIISTNSTYGVQVRGDTSGVLNNFSLTNATLSTNANAVNLQIATNAVLGNATLDNITANNNSTNGVYYQLLTNGVIGSSHASNIIADNNGNLGFYIIAQTSSMASNITVNNLITNANGTDGIRLYANGGSLNNINLSNVTSNQNASIGLYTLSSGAGSSITNLSLNNITTNNNSAAQGININTGASGIINGVTINNATASNNLYGLYINQSNTASGITNISVSNSNFINNTTYGIYLVNNSTTAAYNVDFGGGAFGSTGQNRLFGNGSKDIRISYVSGGNVIARNNWWGDVNGLQPGRVTLSASTTIDSSAYLTTDPRP